MKRINIKKLTNDLNYINASEAKKTIIVNNAEIYNDLIKLHKESGDKAYTYSMIMSYNGMIIKQINELEKMTGTKGGVSDDKFQDLVTSLKNNKTKTKYETR